MADPSAWLTHEFLENTLTGTPETDFARLLSYNVTLATKKGDNYASEMYRVVVQYETATKERTQRNIIMKVIMRGCIL